MDVLVSSSWHVNLFEAVGGFNEVLVGYGFDDKDLKARLQSLNYSVQLMKETAIGVIPHSIHERGQPFASA